MRKIIAFWLVLVLTGCKTLPNIEVSDNVVHLDTPLSQQIIKNISKVKGLYDLATLARGIL